MPSVLNYSPAAFSPEYLHAVALEGFYSANRGMTLTDAIDYAFASTSTKTQLWHVDPRSEPTAEELKVVGATVRAMQVMLDPVAVPFSFVRILCAFVDANAELGI